MILFAIIPVMFIVLMWRWLVLRGFGVREALLAVNVIYGVLVVFSTETLTLVHQLHFLTLFLFWSAAAAAVGLLLLRIPGAFGLAFPKTGLGLMEKTFLGMGAFIIFVVGFIALAAPPNTWDSMTYHMSRVAHWQQNNGVMNYPTNIIRQLVYFPYAEYVILHLQVLGGSDRFANMVQWGAMVLSATGVSLIARLLGLRLAAQIMAAVLSLTIPMLILQGSSTQNDLVVTSLLVSGVYFIFRLMQNSQHRWIALAAASIGLAALTKGTGALLFVPFIGMSVFFTGVELRRKCFFLAALVLAVVVLTGPFFLRLRAIDRDPVAATQMGGNLFVDKSGVVETVSNGVRNLFMQLALPAKEWDQSLESLVAVLHRALGIDVNAPATTTGGTYSIIYYPDEDYMTNPFHMALVLVAGILFLINLPTPGESKNLDSPGVGRFYAAALAIGVLLFCMTLKWQPWISRFHLPMFVLAMPLVAAVIERFFSRRDKAPSGILAGIVIVAFLCALHPLFFNNTRRIFGNGSIFLYPREHLYFVKKFPLAPVVGQAVWALNIKGCRDVGLKLGADDWEYPWQVFLGKAVRVEHVGVNNATAAFMYPGGEFHPCEVIDMVSVKR